MSRAAIFAAAAWLAAAACLAAFARPAFETAASAPTCKSLLAGANYYDSGEALIHGLPFPPTRLPASTVLAGLLSGHAPGACRTSLWGAYVAGGAAVGALAALAGGPAAASGALWLLAWLRPPEFYERLFLDGLYAFLVACVALIAASRAGRPSLPSALALALAIGATLQFRSALFLLGPVLAASELLRRGREAKREAAILCVVPWLTLIPWIWMNARISGRFIPLEDDASRLNVVAAALGMIDSPEGDWRALAGLGADANALAWSVAEIARRPSAYLEGLAGRVHRLFWWQPLLFGLAAAGFWLRRREQATRAVGLIAGYLTAAHLLMTIQPRYFAPLWPLAAVLAAGLLPRPSRPDWERRNAFCRAAALLVLVPAAVLGLYAAGKCVALGWSRLVENGAGLEARVDAELARRPGDAWLQARKGELRLAAGDASAAVAHYEKALALEPDGLGRAFDAARARLAAGEARAVLDAALEPDRRDPAGVLVLLARARAWVSLRKFDRARRELAAARDHHLATAVRLRGDGPGQADFIEALKSGGEWVQPALALGAFGPKSEQKAYNALLLEFAPPRAREAVRRRQAALD